MEGACVRTAFILLKSLESLDTVQVGLTTPENMCNSIWNSEDGKLMINEDRREPPKKPLLQNFCIRDTNMHC